MDCNRGRNGSLTCVFVRTVLREMWSQPTSRQSVAYQVENGFGRAADLRREALRAARAEYQEICDDQDATLRRLNADARARQRAFARQRPAIHPLRSRYFETYIDEVRRRIQTTCALPCGSDAQCLEALDSGRRAVQTRACYVSASAPTTVVFQSRRRGNRSWWEGVVVNECGQRTVIRIEGSGTNWTYTQTPGRTQERVDSTRSCRDVPRITYRSEPDLGLAVQCESVVLGRSLIPHPTVP